MNDPRLPADPDVGSTDRELLEATLASMLDPHVLLEPVRDSAGDLVDAVYRLANNAACEYLGKPAADLVGQRFSGMNSPDATRNVLSWCRATLQGDGGLALDDVPIDSVARGGMRWFDVRAARVGGAVSLTWRDRTEQHLAAVELAESEALYRLIADNATDVIIRSTLNGIEWVSPAVTEVLGWRPEELVGTSMSELMHPEDLRTVRRIQQQIIADGSMEGRTTARFRTADGAWRWMSDHGRAILADDGSVEGGIDSLRDVQAEHEAALALQRREQELRGIIDSLQDPWVQFNAVRGDGGQIIDFVFVDANEAACEANHMPRERLLGARLLEVLPEHRPSGIFDQYVAVVETGVPLADDDRPFTSPFDGHVRRFDNRAVRVGDGISLTWRDVTERYDTRQRLRRQAEQDSLTGAANRLQLERRMREILGRQRRTGDRVAVLYCDLDHFKDVNDTLGHAAGDEVLMAVAQQIRAVVREGDVVARMGGDEFVVILDGVRDAADATAVAGKIHDAIAVPVVLENDVIEPHVSIGLAVATADEDPNHALARADRALYEAKRSGRNRVVLAAAALAQE